MSKKLFKVTWEGTFMVVAENEDEARDLVEYGLEVHIDTSEMGDAVIRKDTGSEIGYFDVERELDEEGLYIWGRKVA